MKLLLTRDKHTRSATLGTLVVQGPTAGAGRWLQPVYHTLEDIVRPAGVKLPGATAIPAGEYQISLTFSPRFKQSMPLLLGVPGFEGVRIHWGNLAKDTEGCILVGEARDVTHEAITRSRAAYAAVFAGLSLAAKHGERNSITIVEDFK